MRRLALVAGAAAWTLALACAPGGDLHYLGGAADAGGADATAPVDATAPEATTFEADVRTVPIQPPPPLACTGIDPDAGGCDPGAGEGCCFSSGAAPNCVYSAQVFLPNASPSACRDANDVFVSCDQDDGDSPCCWGKSTSGALFTRSASDCGSDAHACVPGTRCTDGSDCTTITCNGQPLGYCMGAAPPCKP